MDKVHDWKSERARELAQKKGLGEAELAIKLGLAPRSVYSFMAPNPQRKPGKPTLILLAHILGTNPDYLTFKSDDPKPRRIA